jgi:alpha-tubulin suppressor-like RCC1 family protein
MVREGKVLCWGLNHVGQLGQSTATSCAVTDAALLLELGLPGPSIPCATEPLEVPGMSSVKALYVFGNQSCAVAGDGVLRCWGQNDVAQLASAAASRLAPTTFPSQTFSAFALGGTHGCGTFDGTRRLRCWGSHALGQLGVGSAALSTCAGQPCAELPTALANLVTADALSLGDRHSCALLSSGTVSCWGSDDHGQLGNSDDAIDSCSGEPCAKAPVAAFGLDRVTVLRSGRSHSCALRDDGDVMCWGSNRHMQCNGASRSDVAVPTKVYGLH